MVWKRRSGTAVKPDQEAAPLRVLTSPRLFLVAADVCLVRADLADPAALAARLQAVVPQNWPPELYDGPAMSWSLRQLEDPAEQGWSFWYLLSRDTAAHELIGVCGFKGRPDSAGSVEIGYSVLAQYRNRGFATEAVEALVAWAFSHQQVREVSAETLPHLRQSIRVMEKNGFAYVGAGSERGVIRYVVSRPDRR